ncbi:hypothetical protein TNCV_250911 [Trichonephila clavipes]|nr:hypothetical protein TNCV_250911 [Trichonephila clavipes]
MSFACTRPRPVSVLPDGGDEHPPPAAVGCLYHRSVCTKTRPDSRLGPRRKNDEHPPPSGCGRMSLPSFRVHQDTTGQQSSDSTEKR